MRIRVQTMYNRQTLELVSRFCGPRDQECIRTIVRREPLRIKFTSYKMDLVSYAAPSTRFWTFEAACRVDLESRRRNNHNSSMSLSSTIPLFQYPLISGGIPDVSDRFELLEKYSDIMFRGHVLLAYNIGRNEKGNHVRFALRSERGGGSGSAKPNRLAPNNAQQQTSEQLQTAASLSII